MELLTLEMSLENVENALPNAHLRRKPIGIDQSIEVLSSQAGVLQEALVLSGWRLLMHASAQEVMQGKTASRRTFRLHILTKQRENMSTSTLKPSLLSFQTDMSVCIFVHVVSLS